jgi:hypothetical protein
MPNKCVDPQSHIAKYYKVPDGSHLEILLENLGKPAEAPNFRFNGEIWDSRGNSTPIKKPDAFPNPYPHPLTAPEVYFAEMEVAWNGQATVRLTVCIRKPNGDLHSVPYCWTMNRKTGAETRYVNVLTA